MRQKDNHTCHRYLSILSSVIEAEMKPLADRNISSLCGKLSASELISNTLIYKELGCSVNSHTLKELRQEVYVILAM